MELSADLKRNYCLGQNRRNVLHFAEAEILKPNNSPDLDHFILTDSGVAADNAFDLLRVSGKWCTLNLREI